MVCLAGKFTGTGSDSNSGNNNNANTVADTIAGHSPYQDTGQNYRSNSNPNPFANSFGGRNDTNHQCGDRISNDSRALWLVDSHRWYAHE